MGQIDNASLILLLVSPSFMASEYAYGVEVDRALQREQSGHARVIPVILRPVEWRESPLGRLQPLPKDGKPITEWKNRDQALVHVVKDLSGQSLPAPTRGRVCEVRQRFW